MGTTMSLAEFYKYSRNSRKRIADIYREIEEIQFQFNELYSRQVEERSRLVATHAPQLLEAPEDLPAELRQLLEQQEQAERRILADEAATLSVEIEQKRETANGMIEEAQRQVTYLREQNPILDQQEEELKSRLQSMEDEIQMLDTEIKQLSITHFFERRRLRQEQQQVAENLGSVKTGIRTVREKWVAEKENLQAAQVALQGKWQALSVEISQLQARLDFVISNIDALTKQNAAHNLLANLQELPTVEGEWQERLKPIAELGLNKSDYEAGLTSVAEILGLLKGLGEGMDRFIRSVGTVYEEQRRYKLPSLTVDVSDAVTSLHAVWPDFQSKVKDEKYLGTHPLEFNQRIQKVVQERISEQAIQEMFDDMGGALSTATQAWR